MSTAYLSDPEPQPDDLEASRRARERNSVIIQDDSETRLFRGLLYASPFGCLFWALFLHWIGAF